MHGRQGGGASHVDGHTRPLESEYMGHPVGREVEKVPRQRIRIDARGFSTVQSQVIMFIVVTIMSATDEEQI